jgi:hypothetical protein
MLIIMAPFGEMCYESPMSDDFEDDGASFRVRRERWLNERYTIDDSRYGRIIDVPQRGHMPVWLNRWLERHTIVQVMLFPVKAALLWILAAAVLIYLAYIFGVPGF